MYFLRTAIDILHLEFDHESVLVKMSEFCLDVSHMPHTLGVSGSLGPCAAFMVMLIAFPGCNTWGMTMRIMTPTFNCLIERIIG